MSSNFIPSPFQQAYFAWVSTGRGSAILEAVAGAGKTTTLLEGCALMQGRIWLGVYNKKMGDELKEKIARKPELRARTLDARSPRALFTSTFHSAGSSALRFAFGKQHRLEVDDKKVQKLADAVALGRPDLADLVPTALRMVGMAKNRGFGALGTAIEDLDAWLEMTYHFDLDSDLPEDTDLTKVVRFAQVLLRRSNESLDTIDFDDMVYLPVLKRLRMLKHEWVLIDEAQDTNPTRREMARMLLAPGGRLVAIGDPRQAIFGFTGADNDSLEQIATEHSCVRLPLTITYRCPKAVVRHAQQWVDHIQAGDSAPEGSVTTLAYPDLAEKVQIGDAIVCRYNAPLVKACFGLIRAGKPAKIEGRAIGEGLNKLAGKWKVKKLTALRDRLAVYKTREIEKALKRDDEQRADRIKDQVDTLEVLIERAEEQKFETVAELQTLIAGMFADGIAATPSVVLCSAHKSKGMEWDNVFLLGREEYMPARFATQDWQVAQENNLIYVAVTRAKLNLIEVAAPP